MPRRILALLALAIAPARPAGVVADDLAYRLVKFHRHYNNFFRTYFGCPTNAIDTDECKPGQGRIDYAELRKVIAADPFPSMKPQ